MTTCSGFQLLFSWPILSFTPQPMWKPKMSDDKSYWGGEMEACPLNPSTLPTPDPAEPLSRHSRATLVHAGTGTARQSSGICPESPC